MSIWAKIIAQLAAMRTETFSDLFQGIFSPTEPAQTAKFTMAMIALSAKMAKADGVVTHDEVDAFRSVFTVAEAEKSNVARLFNLAKRDVAGFDAYARQIADLFSKTPETLRDVIDCLFTIAAADGVLHPAENVFIGKVAETFGIDDLELRFIRSRFVSGGNSPYDALGVEPDVSDDALRRAYHRLVAECHPDRLIARGVPEEFLSAGTRKLAAINTAYEEIEMMRRRAREADPVK